MIEPNNPHVDVSVLMQKIEDEVRRRRSPEGALDGDRTLPADALATAATIDGLIRTAEEKAQVRMKWSGRLNRFPFNISPGIQRFCLRTLAFLFKDQRHVNFAIIEVLRETLAQNLRLTTQLDRLRARLNRVEDRLAKLEQGLK